MDKVCIVLYMEIWHTIVTIFSVQIKWYFGWQYSSLCKILSTTDGTEYQKARQSLLAIKNTRFQMLLAKSYWLIIHIHTQKQPIYPMMKFKNTQDIKSLNITINKMQQYQKCLLRVEWRKCINPLNILY